MEPSLQTQPQILDIQISKRADVFGEVNTWKYHQGPLFFPDGPCLHLIFTENQGFLLKLLLEAKGRHGKGCVQNLA